MCNLDEISASISGECNGEAQAVVCPICASVALLFGNVILRMPCADLAEFNDSLSRLKERWCGTHAATVTLAGTGVSLVFKGKELDALQDLARHLATDEVFLSCCGRAGEGGPSPVSVH